MVLVWLRCMHVYARMAMYTLMLQHRQALDFVGNRPKLSNVIHTITPIAILNLTVILILTVTITLTLILSLTITLILILILILTPSLLLSLNQTVNVTLTVTVNPTLSPFRQLTQIIPANKTWYVCACVCVVCVCARARACVRVHACVIRVWMHAFLTPFVGICVKVEVNVKLY